MKTPFVVAVSVGIVVNAWASLVRAEDAAAPPPAAPPAQAAPPPEAPSATPPPAAAPSPQPTESPAPSGPAEMPAAPPAAVSPRVTDVERPAPPNSPPSGLVVALRTTGFLSSLDGGFFVGGRAQSGTIWGVGMEFGVEHISGSDVFLFGEPAVSSSAFGLSIYPGVETVLASARDGRVDLVGNLTLGFTKYYATDGNSTAVSDGYGFWANAGPGLRLWVTPSLALSYAALLDVIYRTDRAPTLPGQVTSPNVVDSQGLRGSRDLHLSFYGQLELLGVF
jgi:hypothetical protein